MQRFNTQCTEQSANETRGGMSIPVLKQLMYVDQVRISPSYNHLYPLFSPNKNNSKLFLVFSLIFFLSFLPGSQKSSSRQLI